MVNVNNVENLPVFTRQEAEASNRKSVKNRYIDCMSCCDTTEYSNSTYRLNGAAGCHNQISVLLASAALRLERYARVNSS